MRFDLRIFLISALLVFTASTCHADDITTADVYKSALPSIMTLEVKLADGDAVGTGFLAIKDGVAVTAWHVVNGAKSVKAKFADGEVDDVTGLIDKDEKNDVALIRVNESGRALLDVQPKIPKIGSKAIVIGAPRALDFSVSDGIVSQYRETQHRREIQFTAPISPGNSGGPLMSGDGSVIGVVVTTRLDAQNVNFAIPIRKVVALDPTLPAQPWSTVESTESAASDPEDDRAIGDALVALVNASIGYADSNEKKDGHGYLHGMPGEAYVLKLKTYDAIKSLDDAPKSDDDKAEIIKDLKERLTDANSALDYLAKAVHVGEAMRRWNYEAKELLKEANAIESTCYSKPYSDNLIAWSQSSYATTRFSSAQLYILGFTPDPTNFTLGCTLSPLDSPNTVPVVFRDGLADKLGMRSGDIVTSVGGSPVVSLLDLKVAIDKNRGQNLKIVVSRNGKEKDLQPKIPDDLAKSQVAIDPTNHSAMLGLGK